ncbi:MAG: hypothetical protein ACYCST_20875 [Acidimicrobiales bacterium]
MARYEDVGRDDMGEPRAVATPGRQKRRRALWYHGRIAPGDGFSSEN